MTLMQKLVDEQVITELEEYDHDQQSEHNIKQLWNFQLVYMM